MPQHTEAELRKRVSEEVARRNRLAVRRDPFKVAEEQQAAARARDLRTVNNEATRARDEAPEPLTSPGSEFREGQNPAEVAERLELGRKKKRR